VSGAVSIDGVVIAPERAVVSVFDRGFLFGDGVFESLRVYGGRAFAASEHIARLARSAGVLGFTLPVGGRDLEAELDAAIAASSLEDAYARVILTRGAANPVSLAPPAEPTPTRVILVQPLRVPSRAVYAAGLRAVTLPLSPGAEGGPASRAKLLSYTASILALERARAQGAEEAIFVTAEGFVCDASTSNVVVVRGDGSLVTPPDGPGVLAGITRGHVVDLARAMGAPCSFEPVTLAELIDAREILLTSSVREIVSVVSLDGRAIGDGAPGEKARSLHRAYRQRAGAREGAPWE
jgi:branched-chain amino acid aminotransferase